MTLAEILAALQGKPSGAAQPVRTTPEGGLDLRAILAGAQIGQTQKSPYERTMRPGETRSAGDVQDMLAEVILAAGSGALPGVGPRGQARQAPARVRPGFEKQFDTWFGGSKAVDEAGRPLTVFTGGPGTNKYSGESIREFKKGPSGAIFFSSSPSVASEYAESRGRKTGGATYPSHLAMKNPLVHDEAKGFIPQAELLSRAQSGGHDGLIIRNAIDSPSHSGGSHPSDVFVVFSPTQIKSATGNRGAYNPNSPRIDE